MHYTTTPLQFGYFLALLFTVLLIVRGLREERTSDILLGLVVFLLGMEIQDYTFGNSGINYLWVELNGFPRYFGLAFAPMIYLYLKAQINREFKFQLTDLKHFIPYFVYFIFHFIVFLNGKTAIDYIQKSDVGQYVLYIESIATWVLYIVYFTKSLRLYKAYKNWIEGQFSDTNSIGFEWIRNFIFLIIAGEIFKWIWLLADFFMHLPFTEDWWWNLFTVFVIIYVAVSGYTQIQPKRLIYSPIVEKESSILEIEKGQEVDYSDWKKKIDRLMNEEKVYLDPELSLNELATKLKTNSSVISATINKNFGKNFNDFINEFRIEAFKEQIKLPQNKQYTILAVALDCGFNSKATFNRAFKKVTGGSPKDFIE